MAEMTFVTVEVCVLQKSDLKNEEIKTALAIVGSSFALRIIIAAVASLLEPFRAIKECWRVCSNLLVNTV
jgi:hypothetical protein